MPNPAPSHPVPLSASLVQQPVVPAETLPPPSASSTLPLRLKVTFDLLVPSGLSANARGLRLAQVAQAADVYPWPAQGGRIEVRAGLTVRGQRLPALGWASERLRDVFLTNTKELGLAEVLPWDDGRFEVQATSRAPIQHVPGDRPLAFLTALAIQLSWGSKSPRYKAGRRSKKPVDDDGARQNAGSVTNAQSTDHREAQDKAAEGAFATEQKQITEESIALTTADDLSQDVRIMRRTLDACLLRLVQSQLVKHFPLVFNGPHTALRTHDLPSVPSVAASMRTVVQNMTDKSRKKEAKRLYEDLAQGLRSIERRETENLKGALRGAGPSNSAQLSSFDSNADDASEDGTAPTAETGTAEDFEATLVGGLQCLWSSKLRPKRITTVRMPTSPAEPSQPPSRTDSATQGSPAMPPQPLLNDQPILDAFEPLDFFDDDLLNSLGPSSVEVEAGEG